ncbi:MAG TPA: hypothetical protein VF080_04590 [Solirubrobacteraceae bacterium]
MRKLLFGAIVALVGVLAVVGVASAVDAQQAINVTVTNNKAGTKEKPKSLGKLNVVTTTTPGPGSPAGTFATNKATIFFDKNIVFNGKAFKECKPSNASAPVGSEVKSKCGSAKIGSGKAAGQATIGGQENLTVTAYNGAPTKANAANRWFYLHVEGSTPLVIDSVIAATLKRASGDYGYKLEVPIPANLVQPLAGVTATLLNFSTSVGGTSKGLPYVGLKGCSGGKLKFKGTFVFTDNTSKTVTDTAACKK